MHNYKMENCFAHALNWQACRKQREHQLRKFHAFIFPICFTVGWNDGKTNNELNENVPSMSVVKFDGRLSNNCIL